MTVPARGARPHRRPFEPTDLELEDSGVAELDWQGGVVRGDGASGNRLVLSDVEFNLGLQENVEFDVDCAFGYDNFGTRSRALVGEPLWTAMKLGLGDAHDDDGPSYAFGVQLGPRLPTIRSGRGVGYETLALAGLMDGRTHLVANLGGLVDPGAQIGSGRPTALLGGLDLDQDLDAQNTFSLLAELGGAYYVGPDPDDVHATLGISWSTARWLDLSLVGFAGFLPGGDRLGVFLGASPKVALW